MDMAARFLAAADQQLTNNLAKGTASSFFPRRTATTLGGQNAFFVVEPL
jgi:hypothetical protein